MNMQKKQRLATTLKSQLMGLTVMLFLCGCEREGIVLSRANGSGALDWSWDRREGFGAGPAHLQHLNRNVERARYYLDPQTAVYLFQGDLGAGISGGQYLALPSFEENSPWIRRDGERLWMDTAISNPRNWSSYRAYHSGECSVLLDWDEELLPSEVPAYTNILAREIDTLFANCDKGPNERFTRVGNARITPILRARPGGAALSNDDDMVRFSARYRARSIAGCSPVNLDVSFDMGFRRATDGQIMGVVQNVEAEVAGYCIGEEDNAFRLGIESKVKNKISNSAPAALASAVRERFLINPTRLGISTGSIPTCNSDADCQSAWRWGGRCTAHQGANQCWIQLDVDRVNTRPEGLEFVLFETANDPQRALFTNATPGGPFWEHFFCGVDRLGNLLPPDFVTGTVRSYSVATSIDPSMVCR